MPAVSPVRGLSPCFNIFFNLIGIFLPAVCSEGFPKVMLRAEKVPGATLGAGSRSGPLDLKRAPDNHT